MLHQFGTNTDNLIRYENRKSWFNSGTEKLEAFSVTKMIAKVMLKAHLPLGCSFPSVAKTCRKQQEK